MSTTLTLKELDDYRNFVGRAWLNFELRATKLNNVGSKDSMEEGNELMIYYYLLTQMGDHLFFDNNYKSLVSTRDIANIIKRVNQIKNER